MPIDDTTDSKAACEIVHPNLQHENVAWEQAGGAAYGPWNGTCARVAAALDAKDAALRALQASHAEDIANEEEESQMWRDAEARARAAHAAALICGNTQTHPALFHRPAAVCLLCYQASEQACKTMQKRHAEDLRVAVEQAREERDRYWKEWHTASLIVAEARAQTWEEAAKVVESAPDVVVTSNMWISLGGGMPIRGCSERKKIAAALRERGRKEKP